MASLHDMMAKPAVAALMRQFGDRDTGGFKPILYRDPRRPADKDRYEWAAIVHEERFERVYNPERGETSLRVVRTVQVPTENVVASGVTEFQPNAEITVGDKAWALNEETSRWGESFVVFGLVREPLVSMNELRSASV